jgi:hypothetical protein
MIRRISATLLIIIFASISLANIRTCQMNDMFDVISKECSQSNHTQHKDIHSSNYHSIYIPGHESYPLTRCLPCCIEPSSYLVTTSYRLSTIVDTTPLLNPGRSYLLEFSASEKLLPLRTSPINYHSPKYIQHLSLLI